MLGEAFFFNGWQNLKLMPGFHHWTLHLSNSLVNRQNVRNICSSSISSWTFKTIICDPRGGLLWLGWHTSILDEVIEVFYDDLAKLSRQILVHEFAILAKDKFFLFVCSCAVLYVLFTLSTFSPSLCTSKHSSQVHSAHNIRKGRSLRKGLQLAIEPAC